MNDILLLLLYHFVSLLEIIIAISLILLPFVLLLLVLYLGNRGFYIWKSLLFIMRQLKGYEGIYWITKEGRVFNKRKKELKGSKDFEGYISITLRKNNKSINKRMHRLVLETFKPNHEKKLFVNHKNGIKHDNRLENLEWVTASENHLHAFKIGLRKAQKGEKHGNSKLKDEQVREIKKLIEEGKLTNIEIGKLFNVSHQTISSIKMGKNWSWIE